MVSAIYKNGMQLPLGEPGELIKIEPPDFVTISVDNESGTTVVPCKRQLQEIKYWLRGEEKVYRCWSNQVDLAFCLTVHSAQGQTLDRAILVLGRSKGRSNVSWSLLYVALSRVRALRHLRFFPHGSRGSMECFSYLTSLRKPPNFVKWLQSYDNGVWDPTILMRKQLKMEKAILSKLSALGRDTTLSQKNAVILGYLKALGYGGLYSLKRGGLQRKLDAHMVEKQIWEPAKGNIERPTKRRSWKKKKLALKGKKHVHVPLQKGAAKHKKKTKPTKKKKKKVYVPRLVQIPNHPPMYTRYNRGEGNCFFHALQQGLEKLGVTFLNEGDIRENLAAWFQVEANQIQFEAHIGGPPSSFIGHLRDTGLNTPAVGWESYLAGKNWGWWGEHVRRRGTWVGALEAPIINKMMDNAGLNVVVNIFDQRYGRLWGDENNGTKQVIMLYLSPGNFELLEEALSSSRDNIQI